MVQVLLVQEEEEVHVPVAVVRRRQAEERRRLAFAGLLLQVRQPLQYSLLLQQEQALVRAEEVLGRHQHAELLAHSLEESPLHYSPTNWPFFSLRLLLRQWDAAGLVLVVHRHEGLVEGLAGVLEVAAALARRMPRQQGRELGLVVQRPWGRCEERCALVQERQQKKHLLEERKALDCKLGWVQSLPWRIGARRRAAAGEEPERPKCSACRCCWVVCWCCYCSWRLDFGSREAETEQTWWSCFDPLLAAKPVLVLQVSLLYTCFTKAIAHKFVAVNCVVSRPSDACVVGCFDLRGTMNLLRRCSLTGEGGLKLIMLFCVAKVAAVRRNDARRS